MAGNDVKRVRAFRTRGRVHFGLLPGILLALVAVVAGSQRLAIEWPDGRSSPYFVFGFVCVAGAAVALLSLIWQALIAYGIVPLVVVWRSGGRVWFGSVVAFAGLSRRRELVPNGAVRVALLSTPGLEPKDVRVFRLLVTTGDASSEVRTRGAVDPQMLQTFLVSSASADCR